MPSTIDWLNERMAIPGAARFDEGEGGLTRLTLNTPEAAVEIYLHGGHVTRYRRRHQQPILWMSEKSWFEAGKPIRGGVPVIFPWFGPRAESPASVGAGQSPESKAPNPGANPGAVPGAGAVMPNHGFARLMVWHVEKITQPAPDKVVAVLSLKANDATRAAWPGDFELTYTIELAGDLRMTLRVANIGSEPFTYEEALHTYLAVGDVRQARVAGLEGASYLDTRPNASPSLIQQGDQPITVDAETDRLYLYTTTTCELADPVLRRRVAVMKEGSDATVVWNPWIAKAKAMPDFGDDEWPGMICIETCNVRRCAVRLEPGDDHRMTAVLRAAGEA